MGLSHKFLERFVQLKKDGLLDQCKSIADIGSSQVSDVFLSDEALIGELCKLHGKDYIELDPSFDANSSGDRIFSKHAPYAKKLFEYLGYEYTCFDVDGASFAIPIDLNFKKCPRRYKGRFDIVLNLGTSEHIFNQLGFFRFFHNLTHHESIMIHEVPSQGNFIHGLINYDMKFFWTLSGANAYRQIFACLDCDEAQFELHKDIQALSHQYNYQKPKEWQDCRYQNCHLFIVHQRLYNLDFQYPLDECSNSFLPKLKKKYPIHFYGLEEGIKILYQSRLKRFKDYFKRKKLFKLMHR